MDLVIEANLAEGEVLRGERNQAIAGELNGLTWLGHDFLDAARDETIWKKAREKFLKPSASWTFSLVLEWLKHEARQRMFGDSAGGSTPA